MSLPLTAREQRRQIASFVIAGIVCLFACVSLFAVVPTDRPMSIVDEHVHFDYALHIHEGTLPYRGALINQQVVDEWACGVGHEAGPLPVACGDGPTASDVPSGAYSTAYIHYPTYFVAAEAFRAVVDWISPATTPLQAYRYFSALCMSLGIVALGLGATLLGLRGAGLITAVTVPVASSSMLFLGVIINPGSTAILSGSLIAIAGIWWMRTGRGYLWLLAATFAGAITAVTDVLPAGAFLLAMLAALIGRRFGWIASNTWRPRWRELVLLAAAILLPIIGWGRYIAVTATVGNDALYSFATPKGVASVVAGLLTEITTLHTPWSENGRLVSEQMSPIANLLRIPPSGIALWLTILVFAGLIYVAVRPLAGRRTPRSNATLVTTERSSGFDPMLLLIAGAVCTILLYPPALRLSNVFTFGFDFQIVSRYSIAFAPMLVLLLVLSVRNRAYVQILAVLGVAAVVGLSVSWL